MRDTDASVAQIPSADMVNRLRVQLDLPRRYCGFGRWPQSWRTHVVPTDSVRLLGPLGRTTADCAPAYRDSQITRRPFGGMRCWDLCALGYFMIPRHPTVDSRESSPARSGPVPGQ